MSVAAEYDRFCDAIHDEPIEEPVCGLCGVDCRCSGPYVGEDVASAVIAATHADRWLDARGALVAELAKHVDDGEAMDRIVKLADAYAEVR